MAVLLRETPLCNGVGIPSPLGDWEDVKKTPMFQVVAQATGIPAGELTLEATMNNATASEAFGMYVYQWAKKAKSPARKSAVKDKK